MRTDRPTALRIFLLAALFAASLTLQGCAVENVGPCEKAWSYYNSLECVPAGGKVDVDEQCTSALNNIDRDLTSYYRWIIEGFTCVNGVVTVDERCDENPPEVTFPDRVTRHSSIAVPDRAPQAAQVDLTERSMGVTAAGANVTGLGTLTVCAPGTSVPATGTTTQASMKAKGPIPLADPVNLYQYGFVFDSDGDPNNNYAASANFPNDFFDGTDRWYALNYDPTNSWVLNVTDARGGGTVPMTSSACVVIAGDTLRLIVPFAEVPIPFPRYRVSSFRHTGDFGINPPHDWDGDVEPPVDVGLAQGPLG